MEKMLLQIYDLREYRDSLVKEIQKQSGEHFDTHAASFSHLTQAEIRYLDNLDTMRAAAAKYATGKLVTQEPKHIAAVKQYVKMELLDLSIRNEHVALLDEITRGHSRLNQFVSKKYPDARFIYPDHHNLYTPYTNILKNENI